MSFLNTRIYYNLLQSSDNISEVYWVFYHIALFYIFLHILYSVVVCCKSCACDLTVFTVWDNFVLFLRFNLDSIIWNSFDFVYVVYIFPSVKGHLEDIKRLVVLISFIWKGSFILFVTFLSKNSPPPQNPLDLPIIKKVDSRSYLAYNLGKFFLSLFCPLPTIVVSSSV